MRHGIRKCKMVLLVYIIMIIPTYILSPVYAIESYNVIAEESNVTLLLDGQELFSGTSEATIYPIKYDDTNYLPIQNAENLIERKIVWDNTNNMLVIEGQKENLLSEHIINTSKEYNKKNVAFLENVNIQLEDNHYISTNILKYENTIYIPIRVLCNIANKDIYYDGARNDIIMRSSLSNEEIQSVKTYTSHIDLQLHSLWSTVDKQRLSRDDVLFISSLKTGLDELINTPTPDIKFVKYNHSKMEIVVNDMLSDMSDILLYNEYDNIEYRISELQYLNDKIKRFNYDINT